MALIAQFDDPRHPEPQFHHTSPPYYLADLRDMDCMDIIADMLCTLHGKRVLHTHYDKRELPLPRQHEIEDAATIALRSLRRSWKKEAGDRALLAALDWVYTFAAQYFREVSPQGLSQPLNQKKLRALLTPMVASVLVAYQGTLAGRVIVEPAIKQALFDAEQQER